MKNFIDVYGDEDGKVLYHIEYQWCRLYSTFKQYANLFGKDKERVDLLNEHAGSFFSNVADHFFDAIVMNISRLTDPPITRLGKKNFRNVTITRIPEMKSTPPELKAELESDIKRALDLITGIKKAYRNKRLGHNDLDVMTSERGFIPDSAITSLREMIDSLHAPYRKLRAAVEGVDCRPGVIDDRPEFGLMGALFISRHCKRDFIKSSIRASLDAGGPPQTFPDWLMKNDEEANWM